MTKYVLRSILFFLLTSSTAFGLPNFFNFNFGSNFSPEDLKKEAYQCRLLQSGDFFWSIFCPLVGKPDFFRPPDGGWPEVPTANELQKICSASKFCAAAAFIWGATPMVMALAKPTVKHWTKSCMHSGKKKVPQQKQLDAQKMRTRRTRRMRRGRTSNKRRGVQDKKPATSLSGNKKEDDEQLVLVGYGDMPIVTFDTAWSTATTFMTSIETRMYRKKYIKNNDKQTNTGIVAEAGVEALFAGAADMTYNVLVYGAKKAAKKLELQNPFNTNSPWYKQARKWTPFIARAVIKTAYSNVISSAKKIRFQSV